MMTFRELIQKSFPQIPGAAELAQTPILSVECDSRAVKPGALFLAVKGEKVDGKSFIPEAISRGAAAVLSDGPLEVAQTLPCVRVTDGRAAMARVASVFYGEPSRRMKILGITGTNGKTTLSYLLEHLLRQEGKSVGVLGTINYRFAGYEIAAVETTPGSLRIQSMLAQMVQAGCDWAAMEVSSHALDQKRTDQIDFAGAVFTNLTQDHLDYHGSMEAYFECKSLLFKNLSPGAVAVINADDPWAQKLITRTQARVWTYGIQGPADVRLRDICFVGGGAEFVLACRDEKIPVKSPLTGLHNVYNVSAALATMGALGFSLEKSASSLASFAGVPGRLESVRCGQEFGVFVDFAHTPDGLMNVLKALQDSPHGRIITVFGCGGDRDRTKRPQMAKVAAEGSDFVIVTSDNPRSENPKVIADEVCAGFDPGYQNYAVVLDRRRAIRQALLSARPGDVVLLAGKGHEKSQIIAGVSHPFSDREEAERVLSGH